MVTFYRFIYILIEAVGQRSIDKNLWPHGFHIPGWGSHNKNLTKIFTMVMVISAMEETVQGRRWYWSKSGCFLTTGCHFFDGGFLSLLYPRAPSELSEKHLLCGYLAMSCFFLQSAVILWSWRNVIEMYFVGEKRENFHFSLDKVQFRKCKK